MLQKCSKLNGKMFKVEQKNVQSRRKGSTFF